MRGHVLDVYPDYDEDRLVVWLRTGRGASRLVSEFYPTFYVHGGPGELRDLKGRLGILSSIRSAEFEERRLQLGSARTSKVLAVTMGRYRELRAVARIVDASGGYGGFRLYNVDIDLGQRYLLEMGVFPLALVDCSGPDRFELLDDQWATDYEVPGLRAADLEVDVASEGRLPRFEDELARARVGGEVLEGEEHEVLEGLADAVKRMDPDIVHTVDGDTFVLPYLYHRAEVAGLGEGFQLGRERAPHRAARKGKSYFTYGQIRYRPPFYSLRGRIHIDRESSFIFSEGGLDGLVELSRISGVPLQKLSRNTPGTAISAMQVNQALRDGCLVLWKKNVPERFKTAEELLVSDRGGFIYDPRPGIYEGIVEVDFASLYPSIMVKFNISPETLLCDCCPDSSVVVPKLNYRICELRTGLVPRVLKPLVERRMAYKRARGDGVAASRAKVLKWVLVTCFGYTGYKNARFGRIECHEAINGYGREVMLQASEVAREMGYEVVHGIVDSLWLMPNGHGDHERLTGRIAERTGLPISLEGVYRWLVFLRNKGNAAGALNRYYGLFENGELKVRGIELRRHDTPRVVRDFQTEALALLSSARDARGFGERVPAVLDVMKRYAGELISGRYPLKDLVLTRRVSRELEDYAQFNEQVAALQQLTDEGARVHPGETIRYVACARGIGGRARVKVAELMDGSEVYDARRYLELLARSAESLLQPSGYDEERLLRIATGGMQKERPRRR